MDYVDLTVNLAAEGNYSILYLVMLSWIHSKYMCKQPNFTDPISYHKLPINYCNWNNYELYCYRLRHVNGWTWGDLYSTQTQSLCKMIYRLKCTEQNMKTQQIETEISNCVNKPLILLKHHLLWKRPTNTIPSWLIWHDIWLMLPLQHWDKNNFNEDNIEFAQLIQDCGDQVIWIGGISHRCCENQSQKMCLFHLLGEKHDVVINITNWWWTVWKWYGT